jgi:hypothetical protein
MVNDSRSDYNYYSVEVNFIAVVKSCARTTWNQQDKSRILELIQLIIMHKIKSKV